MERLQKVIANLGYTSRRKAEELIINGKVKVNGEIVKELGTKVKSSDTIEVENTILDNQKNYEYYLLNKPREVISSSKDEHARKTVVDIIDTSERDTRNVYRIVEKNKMFDMLDEEKFGNILAPYSRIITMERKRYGEFKKAAGEG